MRESARLFRSLMLEPLELRAVFSADCDLGLNTTAHSLQLKHDQLEQAVTELLASPQGESQGGRFEHHWALHSPSNNHRGHDHGYDLENTLVPEGEPNSIDLGSNHVAPHQGTAQSPLPQDSQSVQPVVLPPKQPLLPLLGSQGLQRPSIQLESNALESNNLAPINLAVKNVSNSANQNTSSSTVSSAQSQIAPPVSSLQGNSLALANLSAFSGSSTSAAKQTFESSAKSASLESTLAYGLKTDVKSAEVPSSTKKNLGRNEIFDSHLANRAAAVQSLESLLTDLAGNHARNNHAINRNSNTDFLIAKQDTDSGLGIDREQVESRNDLAIADGGLVALALNRQLSAAKLDELAEDVRNENGAWVANIGVFRAFGAGALATAQLSTSQISKTQFSTITRDLGRNDQSSRTAELSDEKEARIRPLLASSSVVLGVMLVGLRRFQKSAKLIHTIRKRK